MIARLAAAAVAVAALSAAALSATPAPDPGTLTSARIHTLTMDTHVDQENRSVLTAMPGDFDEAYRLHSVSFSYMQPGRLHFETVVLNVHFAYTINGDRRYTSVPTYHIHKVEYVGDAPGKKQSLLDVGLLAPEILQDHTLTYLRTDKGQFVYKVTSKTTKDRASSIIWIDPLTHIIARREQYNQDGLFQAYYLYSIPVQPRPHIYVPSRVELYTAKGQLAAVTSYTNIKVNLPVDESIFDF